MSTDNAGRIVAGNDAGALSFSGANTDSGISDHIAKTNGHINDTNVHIISNSTLQRLNYEAVSKNSGFIAAADPDGYLSFSGSNTDSGIYNHIHDASIHAGGNGGTNSTISRSEFDTLSNKVTTHITSANVHINPNGALAAINKSTKNAVNAGSIVAGAADGSFGFTGKQLTEYAPITDFTNHITSANTHINPNGPIAKMNNSTKSAVNAGLIVAGDTYGAFDFTSRRLTEYAEITPFNALSSKVTSNTANISTLSSKVTTDGTNISALSSKVTSNTANISALSSKVTTDATNISTLSSTLWHATSGHFNDYDKHLRKDGIFKKLNIWPAAGTSGMVIVVDEDGYLAFDGTLTVEKLIDCLNKNGISVTS
jgi:hypothetical protein